MSDEVERVLALARSTGRGNPGSSPGGDPFGGPEFRALFLRARAAEPEELDGLVSELVPGLAVDSSFYAACVALSCGTLVEYGASPSIAGAAIAARLLRELDDPDLAQQTGQYLCLATMAHLCRDRALRQQVRRDHGVPASLERMQPRVQHTWFVRTVLELVDDLELLVIAPEQRRAFRVRADAVRTCFHLFTLVQGALIGDPARGLLEGEPEDPELVALATGAQPHMTVLPARQRFHFHDWSALSPEGVLRHDLRSTIWGEASPADIPAHDGVPVVLLGRPVLGGRSWDTNFFANIHDALRSGVTVLHTLEEAEVDAALASIAARAAQLPAASPADPGADPSASA